jgi:hypothetical protein
MFPVDPVTDARIQINEQIAEELCESIFAGELMYSSKSREEMIVAFKTRLAARKDRRGNKPTDLTGG